MASLASINVKFNVDLSDFSSQMQNSLRSIDKWGQKLQSVGRNLSVAVTAPVLLAGVAAKNMATDYEESVNKVDTAFKTASPAVKEFAKTTLEANGIAEATALDMSANFGDMATSMGLPVTAAAKMSTSLVALAGDLASFKNIGIEQANTALNGIFTGETESLKMLGVVMTEANLQQFAYSQGIKGKIKDLDQASKVQLRYNYILSVTKNAQGDFTRTQAGAANQDRIFSEGLKQIGQQLGSIILPLYTKMVTAINGSIKSFSNLSEETKTVIVVVAGLAAAIGPLLFGIGALMSAVPLVTAGFAAFSAAMVTIAPILGVVIAYSTAMYGVYALLGGNATKAAGATAELAKVTNDLNMAVAQGNKNATEEIGKLDKLFATVNNVKASTEERKEAVLELQTLYPAYFKNLDTEAIKNGTAKDSYNQLRDAIFNKARAVAIDTKIQENANARVDKELELREKVEKAESRYQELRKKGDKAATISTTGEAVDFATQKTGAEVIAEAKTYYEASKKSLEAFYAVAKKEDSFLLSAKEQYYAKTGKLQENEVAKAKAAAAEIAKANEFNSNKDVKVVNPGTIAFYENQITALKKQQSEVALTSQTYKKYGDDIEAVQKKIDKISNEKKDFTFAFKDDFSFENTIDNKITAPDLSKTDFSKGIQEAGYNVADLTSKMEFLEEVGNLVSASLSSTFSQLGSSIVQSMGLASSGFEGFAAKIIETGIQLISMLVQQAVKNIAIRQAESVSNAVAGATASGAATGPGAIFTTPGFIATAIAGVLAAFASIPKFETGGIVGGTSFYGDKILARVNSGEMIANTDQQRKIFNSMNASGGGIVTIIPELKIKGSDMIVMFNRANDRKNRIG